VYLGEEGVVLAGRSGQREGAELGRAGVEAGDVGVAGGVHGDVVDGPVPQGVVGLDHPLDVAAGIQLRQVAVLPGVVVAPEASAGIEVAAAVQGETQVASAVVADLFGPEDIAVAVDLGDEVSRVVAAVGGGEGGGAQGDGPGEGPGHVEVAGAVWLRQGGE